MPKKNKTNRRNISWKLAIADRIPLWKAQSTTNDRGCWLFQGTLKKGYAAIKYKKRDWRLHVLVWEHFNGPVPKGLELHHECHNTNCWNPEHVNPQTRSQHWQSHLAEDSNNPMAINAKKTHCPQGHEYSPANTYMSTSGKRHCKPCNRRCVAEYRERKRAGSPTDFSNFENALTL